MSIPVKDYFGGIMLDALNFAWGGKAFEALFYLSIVIILIFEKRKKQRNIFSLYCIISLLIVYCPITLLLSHKIFFQGSGAIIAYYSRLFILLPVVSSISYAFILLTQKVPEKKRIYYYLSLAILIIALRSPTYKMKDYNIADNFEKVPSDVKQISDMLKDVDGQKQVFMPIEPNVYIRTIDASITIPYSRDIIDEYIDNPAARQISGRDEINVDEVSEYCKNTFCDYLVVRTCDEQLFDNDDFSKIGNTDLYTVFEVK